MYNMLGILLTDKAIAEISDKLLTAEVWWLPFAKYCLYLLPLDSLTESTCRELEMLPDQFREDVESGRNQHKGEEAKEMLSLRWVTINNKFLFVIH